MAKIIKASYPLEFSIGILILIFVLSFFLSSQIFAVTWSELFEGTNAYFGMLLVSCAVVIMVLILWEELMFPVKVKPTENGFIFRNHSTKLIGQALIYLIIPVIFAFIYLEYKVNIVRFGIWATICIALPVAAKLISGINNYNDFLKLTDDAITYKNNKKEGTYSLKSIRQIVLLRDERKVLHKFQIDMNDNSQLIIDLDEMELEAFLDTIDKFITVHYKDLVKEK